MLLTKRQQFRFWNEWRAACKSQGWTAANSWTGLQIENERHALLRRVGFESLTHVDPREGYTSVLKELATLQDNLAGMIRADQNPRRVLLHTIGVYGRKLSTSQVASAPLSNPYIGVIMLDRWGHMDIDRLSMADLEQLRYTLAARSNDKRPTPARDQAAASVPSLAAHEPTPVGIDCPF